MKPSIYLETSVVSYYTARPSKNFVIAGFQATTYDLWDRLCEFDVYISDVVLNEASKGDPKQAEIRLKPLSGFTVLEINNEVMTLAQNLLIDKAVPPNFLEDALHLSVAAVNRINVIVTWNFKHINNFFTRMMIRQIIENNGYEYPEICSPNELLGDQ